MIVARFSHKRKIFHIPTVSKYGLLKTKSTRNRNKSIIGINYIESLETFTEEPMDEKIMNTRKGVERVFFNQLQ